MKSTRFVQLAILCSLAATISCDNSSTEPLVRSPGEWDLWPWHTSTSDGVFTLSGVVQPDSVIGQFSVSLLGSTTHTANQTLSHGACSFALRLYRDEALSSAPSWDNRPSLNSPPCPLPLLHSYISASTPMTKRVGTIKPSTLSDSLPSGKYWVAIVLKLDQSVRLIPAGAVTITRS